MKAAIEKALRPANIVNIPQMIKSYYNNVETNIPLDLIMKFAVHAKSFDTEGMKMATLPGHSEYIGGVSYFIPDEYETSRLVQSLFAEQRAVNIIENEQVY